MLKRLLPVVLLRGLLLLAACGKTTESNSDTPGDSLTVATTSGENESADMEVSADTSTPEESAVTSEPTQAATESEVTSQAVRNTQSTGAADNKTQPPSTTSVAPTASEPVTSVPATPSQPSFNAQDYYDYAFVYAISLNLIFDPDMNVDNSAWNAPVNLYAALTDDIMKRNVRSSCERVQREGFSYFGLYLEKQPDGVSYRLYVFYS